MTDQEKKLLMDLNVKVKQIIAKQETLKHENQLQLLKIEDLDSNLHKLRQENSLLEQKYNNLKLAKMLVVSDEDNKDAKNRIQKLVREIDKCIALLNK